MLNILIIGSHDIMKYVSILKNKCNLKTYKSLSLKCKEYEILDLNETNINFMDVLIFLDDKNNG